jgi:hypothetical protein
MQQKGLGDKKISYFICCFFQARFKWLIKRNVLLKLQAQQSWVTKTLDFFKRKHLFYQRKIICSKIINYVLQLYDYTPLKIWTLLTFGMFQFD